MHCPQCGQQQTPGEVRFCSRCGFPLGGVTELMANGGMFPSYNPLDAQEASPRRKGVQKGATLLMLGIVTTIIFAILNSYLGTPEFLVALSAVIGFVGGPLRLLYALIFEEGAAPKVIVVPGYAPPNTPASLGAHVRQTALPPAHSAPVPAYRPLHNTAEIVRPSSVTEGTTRLLEKEQEYPER